MTAELTLPLDHYRGRGITVEMVEGDVNLTIHAAPIVIHQDEDGDLIDWTPVRVTADDLLTIAARLTQLAHAIQPPPHDPDAEEWTFTWDGDHSPRSTGMTKAEAQARADLWANVMPDDAPYRVVHVSELGR